MARYVADYAARERLTLNQRELEAFALEIVDEMIGLGPIEPLLKDPSITDILINAHMSVFVERSGQLQQSPRDSRTRHTCCASSTRWSPRSGAGSTNPRPMVDARLPDGSRSTSRSAP